MGHDKDMPRSRSNTSAYCVSVQLSCHFYVQIEWIVIQLHNYFVLEIKIMLTVNFNHFTVAGGTYCKVRHFSKTFDNLSQVAKFIYDHRMQLPDKHGRMTSIYLNKRSGLTTRELKILNSKYGSLCNRGRIKH